ncbi:hydroxymethylbilane synthase [Clostridium cellulovorans]|uniref:Porphobilinogen deaminase n=1 Tax=Clostridium cellulovorans (strain ATCC 35296 / DSM 3052 / OCM 3 / 743B) TaxID=573061 RepID=D9SNY2_CLOC7|nr:hydroxymethylbilane synthase [Clostridium cellulovorans]ADL51947.1 porphobilinogen deaminase [Clostridium cellulovorans 743B]
MKKIIRIGTRKSKLALMQTNIVIDAIKKKHPEINCEVVEMSTKGDEILDKSLLSFGGKGAFVSEFEKAIKSGEIDLAVHSAKDMPMDLLTGLKIVAVTKREDPRDVLVTANNKDTINDFNKTNKLIGTTSLRRKLQIKRLLNNVDTKDLRGNVQRRLEKLISGEYDGIILAAAGLKRLGLLDDERINLNYLSVEDFIPAGGQGIIAVEGRAEEEFSFLKDSIHNEEAMYSLEVERYVMKKLNAGCNEPIGAYSFIDKDTIFLDIIYEHNGKVSRKKGSDSIENRLKLTEKLVEEILQEVK